MRSMLSNHPAFFNPVADLIGKIATIRIDPEKYLNRRLVKRKVIWGCYIDRLNKATGGGKQQCH